MAEFERITLPGGERAIQVKHPEDLRIRVEGMGVLKPVVEKECEFCHRPFGEDGGACEEMQKVKIDWLVERGYFVQALSLSDADQNMLKEIRVKGE